MTPRALKDVLLAKTDARLASTTMADEEGDGRMAGDERMAGDSEGSDGASDGASDGESDEMEPPSPTRSVAGRAPVRP